MDDSGRLSLDGNYLSASGKLEGKCENAEATIPTDMIWS